jgi:hypothetical protein
MCLRLLGLRHSIRALRRHWCCWRVARPCGMSLCIRGRPGLGLWRYLVHGRRCMCSSNKVQHRDEDRGHEEGPPEGEHAGQLTVKPSAKSALKKRSSDSSVPSRCCRKLSVKVYVSVKNSRRKVGLLGAKRRLCEQVCFKRPIVSGRLVKIWREATSTGTSVSMP